jgi:hypothetical protein
MEDREHLLAEIDRLQRELVEARDLLRQSRDRADEGWSRVRVAQGILEYGADWEDE